MKALSVIIIIVGLGLAGWIAAPGAADGPGSYNMNAFEWFGRGIIAIIVAGIAILIAIRVNKDINIE